MKLPALPFIAFCVACLTNLSSAHAEPDEDVLGKALGYPVGDPSTMYSEPNRVGSFSAADKSRPSRLVLKGGWTQPLNKRSGLDDMRYRLLDAQISSFLERNRTTGLLIIKDDKVLVERYRYGRTEESHFYSASASKSIVSLLIGIAVDRKIIASYDDTADRYVPELKASAFGTTSIRNLLRMSSGVKFSESVAPNRNSPSDFQVFSRVQRGVTPGKPLEVLARYSERDFPQGEKFEYITANTAVLGYVLRNAAGKTLADLTAEWLWGSLGAERDAFWLTTSDGMEEAGGGFNATLRDWGRLGVLLANDGKMNGVQVVPKQFLFDATEISR